MIDKQYPEYLNGEWVTPKKGAGLLLGAGFYYGAGCFETMRAEDGSVYKFNEHMNRLSDGLKYLGKEGKSIPSPEYIREVVSEILLKNNLEKGPCRIRVQCSLSERGYAVSNQESVILHVSAEKIESAGSKEFKLGQVQTRVIPDHCKPAHLKLCNMIHYRHAYREAIQGGNEDALMLNMDHYVAETSKANIFWMKGDQIYTPSFGCDILPGIMRNSIIELIKQSFKKKHVIEGSFKYPELSDADLIWVTNSIVEIQRVTHLDGKLIEVDDPFLDELQMNFREFKKMYME